MPRPVRYPVDALLDAAAALLATDGPAAVTMSAVARSVGAPSGSMYHRFPSRAALCGELWLRTEERFHGGFVDALAAPGGDAARCAAAARFVVSWSRAHSDEAHVLLAGADTLERATWPDPLHTRREPLHRALDRELRTLDGDPERIRTALFDVPYAVVRRHLLARRPIPLSAEVIVEDCARALVP